MKPAISLSDMHKWSLLHCSTIIKYPSQFKDHENVLHSLVILVYHIWEDTHVGRDKC